MLTSRYRTSVDAGNAAIEIVFLGVALISLIGLLIAFGRVSLAQNAIAAAARDAARQASIAQSPAAARAAAADSATAAVLKDHLHCISPPQVDVNTNQFGMPLGEVASVSATVSCTVRLSGLGLPGIPWARTIRATFTSPLDPFETRIP